MKFGFLGLALCVPVLAVGLFAGGQALVYDTPQAQYQTLEAAPSNSAPPISREHSDEIETALRNSLVDHEARIYHVRGDVKILKHGSRTWRPARIHDTIEEKDEIRTFRNSFIELYFDQSYLNIIRINENTNVEFHSLEPTSLFISRGEVFCRLDGTLEGTTFYVATPVSLAGITGTRFLRAYNPWTKVDKTQVLEGSLNVIVGEMGGATGSKMKTLTVKQGQGLLFSLNSLEDEEWDKLKPRELTRGRKDYLNKNLIYSFKDLAAFAGGNQSLSRAEVHWRNLTKNIFSVSTIQAETKGESLYQQYEIHSYNIKKRMPKTSGQHQAKKKVTVIERNPGDDSQPVIREKPKTVNTDVPASVIRQVPKPFKPVQKKTSRENLRTNFEELEGVGLQSVGAGYTGRPSE